MAGKRWLSLALSSMALAALPAGAVLADNTGLYIGGSIGRSDERFEPSAYDLSADNVGYQVAAGWRPIGLLAGEIDYVGFGRATGGVNYADTYGVGLSALGFLPIPLLDLYGRVGLMNWRTDVKAPFRSFHRSGADLAYGVGAGVHWGSLGARLEYERYEISATSTMSLASVGMSWTFL